MAILKSDNSILNESKRFDYALHQRLDYFCFCSFSTFYGSYSILLVLKFKIEKQITLQIQFSYFNENALQTTIHAFYWVQFHHSLFNLCTIIFDVVVVSLLLCCIKCISFLFSCFFFFGLAVVLYAFNALIYTISILCWPHSNILVRIYNKSIHSRVQIQILWASLFRISQFFRIRIFV